MQNLLMLVGRVLLAAMFLWSGYGRLASLSSVHNYIADWSIGGPFKPVLVFWEMAGGIALVLGVFTRPVALSLAVFCLLSCFFVHLHEDDFLQLIDFMKNMALIGGFLYVAAFGAGDWSLGKKYRLKWS
jgi:putative oxidoreductase